MNLRIIRSLLRKIAVQRTAIDLKLSLVLTGGPKHFSKEFYAATRNLVEAQLPQNERLNTTQPINLPDSYNSLQLQIWCYRWNQ
jgi:hypothetical protein